MVDIISYEELQELSRDALEEFSGITSRESGPLVRGILSAVNTSCAETMITVLVSGQGVLIHRCCYIIGYTRCSPILIPTGGNILSETLCPISPHTERLKLRNVKIMYGVNFRGT